jgi:hypothetical protein
MKLILALAWLAAVLLVWAWVRAATRRDDDEPDVQPWDERSWTLASGGQYVFVVPTPTTWTI